MYNVCTFFVVRHGMDNKNSAQKLIDAYRIYYNFIREHGSIKKTPAEQAGIKLELGQNKIENLIKFASKMKFLISQNCSSDPIKSKNQIRLSWLNLQLK